MVIIEIPVSVRDFACRAQCGKAKRQKSVDCRFIASGKLSQALKPLLCACLLVRVSMGPAGFDAPDIYILADLHSLVPSDQIQTDDFD